MGRLHHVCILSIVQKKPHGGKQTWTLAESCPLQQRLHVQTGLSANRWRSKVGRLFQLQRLQGGVPAEALPWRLEAEGGGARVMTGHQSHVSPNRGWGLHGDRDAATPGARGHSVTRGKDTPTHTLHKANAAEWLEGVCIFRNTNAIRRK